MNEASRSTGDIDPTDGPTNGRTTLLQFWDRDMPASVAELVESVARLNPSMDHRLYDDRAAAGFIDEAFGAETLRMYETCAIPAMRSDLFRYCFLVHRGGLYVDADYRALRPLADLIEGRPRGLLYRRDRGLANGVMHFRDAEDPLATRILEKALERIARRDSDSVWATTGPGVLRDIYADPTTAGLFEGIRFMRENEREARLESLDNIDYKSGDRHWTVARDKGISLFATDRPEG